MESVRPKVKAKAFITLTYVQLARRMGQELGEPEPWS
jgi:hypothetical protein